MQMIIKTFTAKLLLFACVLLIPAMIASCDKDDSDDNGDDQQNQNNKKQVDEPDKGNGNFVISGDMESSFSAEANFNDTSDYQFFAGGDGKVDQMLILSSTNEQDTTTITAFIGTNNTADVVGEGTYNVQVLDSTINAGCALWINTQDRFYTTTQSATQQNGSITISNRTSNSVEGEIKGIELVETSQSNFKIQLNGKFHAVK